MKYYYIEKEEKKSSTLCWGITKGIILLKHIRVPLTTFESVESPLQQRQLLSFHTHGQFPQGNK